LDEPYEYLMLMAATGALVFQADSPKMDFEACFYQQHVSPVLEKYRPQTKIEERTIAASEIVFERKSYLKKCNADALRKGKGCWC
jgi:hypothetical protein